MWSHGCRIRGISIMVADGVLGIAPAVPADTRALLEPCWHDVEKVLEARDQEHRYTLAAASGVDWRMVEADLRAAFARYLDSD